MNFNYYKLLAEMYTTNEPRTRQVGKTTALIQACKSINGIYITYYEDHARDLRGKFHNVDIISPYNPKLYGNIKPIVFDHYLLMMILTGAYNYNISNESTENLEKINKSIKEELLNRKISELKIGINFEA